MIDYQRQRVYNWEDRFVACKMPTSIVDLSMLKVITDYIWNDLGFDRPPTLHINEAKHSESTGSRYEIVFTRAMVTEYITIHELAHTFNARNDLEHFDKHGPNYVADYCFLLNKYYSIDENYLIGTLSKAKVDINLARFYAHKRKYM